MISNIFRSDLQGHNRAMYSAECKYSDVSSKSRSTAIMQKLKSSKVFLQAKMAKQAAGKCCALK